MSEVRQRDRIVPVRFHREEEYPQLLEAAAMAGYRHPSTFLRDVALQRKATGVAIPLIAALGSLAQSAAALSALVDHCKTGTLPDDVSELIIATLGDVRAAARRIHR